MSPTAQTVIALLIVLTAITYLWRSSRHKKPGTGCGSGSSGCACPAPKARRPLPSRGERAGSR